MRPRRLKLEELLKILVEEHEVVRGRLTRLHTLLERDKHAEAAEELKGFKPYLDQHVIDEEATVLKLLIDSLGREGATRAIQVFQEHREIHQLISEMQAIAETAPERLAEMKSRLAEILERHFRAEETEVFPWALKLYKDKGG
ncbi:MAG: hemerythrin domain-containing protein [Nitrososphaerota archaeon]